MPTIDQAKIDEANRRIEHFKEQFTPAHLDLACHAALPFSLTPDLVYRLWVQFEYDEQGNSLQIERVMVVDLLLSPLCREIGDEEYRMEIAVRNNLLNELKIDGRFGPRRLKKIAEFLIQYLNEPEFVGTDYVKQAQRWTALAYQNPADAIKKIAMDLKEFMPHPASRRDQLNTDWKVKLARPVKTLETLTVPLAEMADYEVLFDYSQSMASYARGKINEAASRLTPINDRIDQSEQSVSVADIDLPIPIEIQEQLIEPVQWPAIWSQRRQTPDSRMRQWLDEVGLLHNPFGPELAEQEPFLPQYGGIYHEAVAKSIRGRLPGMVLGAAGTGKTAAALLLAYDCTYPPARPREKGAFPVYCALSANSEQDSLGLGLDVVVTAIQQALLQFLALNATRLLANQTASLKRLVQFLIQLAGGIEPLQENLKQAGGSDQSAIQAFVRDVEAPTGQLSPFSDTSAWLPLLAQARPPGFNCTYLLLDLGDSGSMRDPAAVAKQMQLLLNLVGPLANRKIYLKFFLPAALQPHLKTELSAIKLVWTTTELTEMLNQRLRIAGINRGIEEWTSLFEKDGVPRGQNPLRILVEAAAESPRRLVQLGNQLLSNHLNQSYDPRSPKLTWDLLQRVIAPPPKPIKLTFRFPYSDNLFVNRKSELEQVKRFVTTSVSVYESSVFLLVGSEGSGKSWLLARLYNLLQLKKDILVVGIDLEPVSKPYEPLNDFDSELFISRKVDDICNQIPEITPSEGGTLWQKLKKLANDLRPLLETKILVILIDAIHETHDEFLREFEAIFLQPLLFSIKNIRIVMTGKSKLYPWQATELRLSKNQIINLDLFSADDSRAQIELLAKFQPTPAQKEYFADNNLSVDKFRATFSRALGNTEAIYALSQGHPLVNFLLAQTAPEQLSLAATLDDVIRELLKKIPDTEQKEIRRYLEAFCVLQIFEDEDIPAMRAVYENDATIGRLPFREYRKVRDKLYTFGLISYEPDVRGYVIQPVLRHLIEEYLKVKNVDLWQKLHQTALQIYERAGTNYEAEARYHRNILDNTPE